jgi:hypothetical protein
MGLPPVELRVLEEGDAKLSWRWTLDISCMSICILVMIPGA